MSSELEDPAELKKPQVDFSFQLNLARDRTEKRIFQYLCNTSKKFYQSEKKIGVLVILGIFGSAHDSTGNGMRKLCNDKMDKYININFNQFEEDIVRIMESGQDGAIVINQDGQILAEQIYLTVEKPTLDIPEGTGTRHIAAASFSIRKDVLAAFTLSEESYFVRVWKNGEYIEQFNPEQKND